MKSYNNCRMKLEVYKLRCKVEILNTKFSAHNVENTEKLLKILNKKLNK